MSYAFFFFVLFKSTVRPSEDGYELKFERKEEKWQSGFNNLRCARFKVD